MPSLFTVMASSAEDENVSSDDGANQLLDSCPDVDIAMTVPSSNVAVTFISSVVPTIPRSVADDPMSSAIERLVTDTAVSSIITVMDALKPPKEAVMIVSPACVASKPRLLDDQDGPEVKSATLVSLEENATRL